MQLCKYTIIYEKIISKAGINSNGFRLLMQTQNNNNHYNHVKIKMNRVVYFWKIKNNESSIIKSFIRQTNFK